MPLQKVRAGERIRTEPLNSIIDAISKRNFGRILTYGQTLVGVNRTGRDLFPGEVAAIDAPNALATSYERVFEDISLILRAPGDDEFAGDAMNWVVAVDRIGDGAAGRICVEGLTMARVRALSSQQDLRRYHPCVTALPDSRWFHLERMPFGGAFLLWVDDEIQESDDGDWQWGAIRVGSFVSCPVLFKVTSIQNNNVYAKPVNSNGQTVGENFLFTKIS